ncbi:hypothetical protein JGS22_001920 [Streptomyces sp. P38-E01]|uniref:Uncharacterized protein n=1 Tax=Streptomyces tardus TaxID=2780544 RepID=A0A949JDI0_9ACTN|nr:hypothetical protein [Streptomyces tardus]MBU7596429.1 hypothetical protein [Streptomyces tardus]
MASMMNLHTDPTVLAVLADDDGGWSAGNWAWLIAGLVVLALVIGLLSWLMRRGRQSRHDDHTTRRSGATPQTDARHTQDPRRGDDLGGEIRGQGKGGGKRGMGGPRHGRGRPHTP